MIVDILYMPRYQIQVHAKMDFETRCGWQVSISDERKLSVQVSRWPFVWSTDLWKLIYFSADNYNPNN